MMKPRIAVCIIAVAVFILSRHYGRSVWHPAWVRFSGERSVADVVNELRPGMQNKYRNISWLTDGRPIALLAFKAERRMELWKQSREGWVFIKAFGFTSFSGELGPKLREGDRQIPEGIYTIEYLNPNSSYYLSLKIGYPNDFDRKKGAADFRDNLGGDIFIHGKNVTVGCIPLGDEAIEELFYIVSENGISHTQVIVSPYDMRVGKRPPDIAGIDWEEELYEIIAESLKPFGRFGSGVPDLQFSRPDDLQNKT